MTSVDRMRARALRGAILLVAVTLTLAAAVMWASLPG